MMEQELHLYERKLASERLFEGKIINVRRDTVLLENETEAIREVIEHPGGVCIVALTEEREVLLVRQFRYPYGKVLAEIPAGKLNYGEDPLSCGKRELLEETGATAECYVDLGQLYPSPGYLNEIIHTYLATGLTFTEQCLDDDEFLDVERVSLDAAVDMVLKGDIKDAKTQAAILKVKLLTEK